ncbi:MAG: hypothetical protein P4L16_06740 [Chlamydiales bacterium]|nr:hypothetical protein [Chlamydiales bacterium]
MGEKFPLITKALISRKEFVDLMLYKSADNLTTEDFDWLCTYGLDTRLLFQKGIADLTFLNASLPKPLSYDQATKTLDSVPLAPPAPPSHPYDDNVSG